MYLLPTNKKNIAAFDSAKKLLSSKTYTSEIEDFVLMIKQSAKKDNVDFIQKMSPEDAIAWDMAWNIFESVEKFTTGNKSLNYRQSLIWYAFQYYNLKDSHKRYFFLNHGYPINIKSQKNSFTNYYTVYKRGQDLQTTFIIDDTSQIQSLLKAIPNELKKEFLFDDYIVDSDSILFIQFELE